MGPKCSRKTFPTPLHHLHQMSQTVDAKLQFLPDFEDSELGWQGYSIINNNYNKNGACSDYNLSSCPSNGNCSSCNSDDSKYKLDSCKSGYITNGNSCVANNCSSLNSSYSSSIAYGKYCEKITTSGLTCYKNCRDISCSNYPLTLSQAQSRSGYTTSTGYSICSDCSPVGNYASSCNEIGRAHV